MKLYGELDLFWTIYPENLDWCNDNWTKWSNRWQNGPTLQIARISMPSCPPWKSTQLWKKSRPKRFITKKVRAFWNRSTKKFEVENFEIFHWEMFIENWMKMKKMISKMKNFEIENFRFFISFFFNWIFNENFSMKIFEIFYLNFFGDQFQNALTFFIINRFGRDFFQSCVDFHGGDAQL